MGISFTSEAGDTLDKLYDACFLQTKTANVWKAYERLYMFEPTDRQYKDGRITAKVFKFVVASQVIPCGSFTILPNGRIKCPVSIPLPSLNTK